MSTRKLTVLVDMDDTIENLLDAWLAYLNDRYGFSVTRDDITEWDMRKAYPSLNDMQVYGALREQEVWDNVRPIDYAPYYMHLIQERGHDIYIVTSSYYKTLEMKLETVLFNYFPFLTYDDVVITSHKQLIAGDVLVDDNPENLIGGLYLGLLFDQPHNRSFEEKKYGIERVKSWEEVYEHILILEKLKGGIAFES